MSTNNRGGALLAVLWLSAALAAIAFSVSTSVRSEIDRVGTTADGLRASYLASGSVDRAIQWMLWGSDYTNPDGSVRFWSTLANKPRLYMSYASGDVVVEMIPEASKLNINSAPADVLVPVIATVTGDPGRARQIVAGILARRVPDPTFNGPSASFQEIEELLQVPGMTPEVFYGNYISDAEGRLYARGGLRDCLSVWGSLGPFDVNSASPALLEAVGVPVRDVQAILVRRQQVPFRDMKDVADAGISTQHVTVGSDFRKTWTVRATARLRRPDGTSSDVVRSAAALVGLVPPPPYRRGDPMQLRVLRSYEDAWSEFAIAPPPVAARPIGSTRGLTN